MKGHTPIAMALRYSLLFGTFTLLLHAHAQPPLAWARNMGNFDTEPAAIATDAQGNVYVCGQFTGTGDFDPGAGSTTLVSAGFNDAFVTKLSPTGQLLWARRFGGSSSDAPKAMGTDAQGNVYLAGTFSGTVDFDPGTGESNLQALGVYDLFVMKLTTSGDLAWAHRFGDDGYDEAEDLVVDANGNVYVSGPFDGTVDFDPGPEVSTLTAGPFSSTVLLKLTSAGAFVRAQQLAFYSASNLAVDAQGHLLVGGSFTGTQDMDPGPGTLNLTSAGMEDGFALRLDANGTLLWAERFGGTYAEDVRSICSNSQGDVIVGGTFESSGQLVAGVAASDVAPVGENDVYVLHLDADGDFVRVHQVGWLDYDGIGAVVTDANDHLHVTGNVRGPVDMDPGTGTFELMDTQSTDAFLLELDADGNFVWASAVHGSANDTEIGAALAVDDAGNLLALGRFLGTADFDPGPGTTNLITTNGTTYVQKFGAGNTSVAEPAGSALALYPNPTRNTLTVQHLSPNARLQLLNAQGAVVRQWQALGNTATLSLQEVPAGPYVLRIHEGERVQALRVVKE